MRMRMMNKIQQRFVFGDESSSNTNTDILLRSTIASQPLIIYSNPLPIDPWETDQIFAWPTLTTCFPTDQIFKFVNNHDLASQSRHRYHNDLKVRFPGYFAFSCEHKALLSDVVSKRNVDVIVLRRCSILRSKRSGYLFTFMQWLCLHIEYQSVEEWYKHFDDSKRFLTSLPTGGRLTVSMTW